MTAFLRWWLLMSVVLVGGSIAYRVGIPQEIYAQDTTRISVAILGVFSIMSLWCGVKTFIVSRNQTTSNDTEDLGYFAAAECLTLGMIGTVIGFIFMLSGFADLDTSNIESVQTFIKNLAGGMAIALYTTLSGLVAGFLLRIQYKNLEHVGKE